MGADPVAEVEVGRRKLVLASRYILYELETEDGEKATLKGYCDGPGLPVPVAIALDEAWADWEDARKPYVEAIEAKALTDSRALATSNRIERIFRRDMLQAAIPGLSEDMANILASDNGGWNEMLREMGHWKTAPETDGAPPDPEVASEEAEPTGAVSSPS